MDGVFWPLDGRLTRVLAWLAGMPNGIAGARLRGRRSLSLTPGVDWKRPTQEVGSRYSVHVVQLLRKVGHALCM